MNFEIWRKNSIFLQHWYKIGDGEVIRINVFFFFRLPSSFLSPLFRGEGGDPGRAVVEHCVTLHSDLICKKSSRNQFFIKSREILGSYELDWSNLPQNSNCGREFVQKSGVQIPVEEGQIFLSSFLIIFIFSIKNWILTHKILFFIFFCQLNIYKNRYIFNKFYFISM